MLWKREVPNPEHNMEAIFDKMADGISLEKC